MSTIPLRLRRIKTNGSVNALQPELFVIIEPPAAGLEGDPKMAIIVRRDKGTVWTIEVQAPQTEMPVVTQTTEADAAHYLATGLWQLGRPIGPED